MHGGAGAWSGELRQPAEEGLEAALDAGAAAARTDPLQACLAAVRVLEDNPLFNAGIGASLNADGEVEHDAGVMIGAGLRAGAVGAVRGVRHPIDLARAVMEDGRHVLLVAEGATRFAREVDIELADPSLFIVDRRREQLGQWRRGNGDTVGAVAFADGHFAAAVSTGGYTGKRQGRVGDSPIPGAGFYADDELGAAVSTGSGEGFMRLVIAKLAVDAMASDTAEAAAQFAIARLRRRIGGSGGIITVDRQGRPGAAFNTDYMPWRHRRG